MRGSGRPLDRGLAALASLRYPWAEVGYVVSFEPGRRGLLGVTVPGTRTIRIYVRDGEDDALLAHVVAHELGHAVDLTYNDERRRTRWRELRGIAAGHGWFTCDRCTDFATGAGDFAEVFAWFAAGPADYRSRLGPPPAPEQRAAVEALFRR